MMKPSFSLWGLVTTSRLSPALRPSMHTRWAEWRSCCSFSFPRAYLLLSNECSFAGISSSSSQQMRCITAGVRTGRAEDSAADTGSKRTPPNAKTLVKQLRERTSVSMGLCKRALEESNWDEEEAVVYLRKSGIARAAKAASREAREGVIAVCSSADGTQYSAVVLNCETDFVQKNPKFVAFAGALAEHCCSTLRSTATTTSEASQSDLVTHVKNSIPSKRLSLCVQMDSTTASASSVSELLADLTTQFGEKVEVSAVECIESGASSCVGVYVHNEVTPGSGVGSAAALVELRWAQPDTSATHTTALRERLSKFARLMAMQVLATRPKFVDLDSMPSSVIEEERSIAEEATAAAAAAAAAGTKSATGPKDPSPPGTKETAFSKIAAQRMQRWLEEQCLLFQEFLMMKQLQTDVIPHAQPEAATNSGGNSSNGEKSSQPQRPITVAGALQLVEQSLGCRLTVSRMRLITVGSQ